MTAQLSSFLAQADRITLNFLKAASHKFYFVHSWIHWPKYLPNLYETNISLVVN